MIVPDAPLKTITIVGGGTAGWMTAGLLSHLFRSYEIRLIESDEIGIIGVGEATIPAIRDYMTIAEIDQVEMIRATQATFKLGIDFVGWKNGDDRYFHGFGRIGQDFMWLHTHQLWLPERAAGRARHFDDYALNCAAGMANKFAFPDHRNPASPMAGLDFAYQFDASLLARYLRSRSEAAGVTRIEGKIVDVALVAKQTLEDFGLVGWPKTSGSRGIHIWVRIEPKWPFHVVRRAALAFAREVERRAPKIATSKWWKEERHGVFLDYNQNARDRTTSNAYSVRPVADARVSMPLAAARLGLSETARVALPMRVRSRKYANPASTTIEVPMLATSIHDSEIGPRRISAGRVAPGSCRVSPP